MTGYREKGGKIMMSAPWTWEFQHRSHTDLMTYILGERFLRYKDRNEGSKVTGQKLLEKEGIS